MPLQRTEVRTYMVRLMCECGNEMIKARESDLLYWCPSCGSTCCSESDYPRVEYEPVVEEKKPVKRSDLEMLRLDGVDKQIAADWLRIRKAHRAPLTDTAWRSIKREAQIAGLSCDQVVRVMAENSWRSFKADWQRGTLTKEDARRSSNAVENLRAKALLGVIGENGALL